MEAHKQEFLIDWETLIKRCEKNKKVKELKGEFRVIELDFGEPVGYCNLIKTTEEDEIIYAKRVGRDNYSRFIKNSEPEITNKLTLVLKKNHEKSNEYYLITMFAGEKNYKEPGDINIADQKELEESLRFWSEHALVYCEKSVVEDSIKSDCPYCI